MNPPWKVRFIRFSGSSGWFWVPRSMSHYYAAAHNKFASAAWNNRARVQFGAKVCAAEQQPHSHRHKFNARQTIWRLRGGVTRQGKNLISEKKYWMQFYLPHSVLGHGLGFHPSKAFGELPGELWKCIILFFSSCRLLLAQSDLLFLVLVLGCRMCESVRVTMLLTVWLAVCLSFGECLL